MSKLDLSDKVAIVTGSTRGIGWSIANTFAENGANIILNGISDPETLKERAEELADKYNVKVKAVLADVSHENGAQLLVKTAHSEFRRLDIMVNNAGVLRDNLIGMIQSADIDATLQINLRSVIVGTQLAARLMSRKKSGSIINLSSIIGRFGNKGQMVYSASKAGVIGATMSAAKELAGDGIRVNAIAPGYIDTDMIQKIPANIHAERMESIAMKQLGKPEHIADTALYLASDLSEYVTGQVIGVDGGMLI